MRILKRNPVSDQTRQRARELRKRSTIAEKKLWQAIRSRQAGVRFRRQAPLGQYVVDFYSPSLGLVIEVDGDSHATEEANEYDLVREEYLRAQGLKIKRYTNREVLNNLDGVLGDLFQLIESSRK